MMKHTQKIVAKVSKNDSFRPDSVNSFVVFDCIVWIEICSTVEERIQPWHLPHCSRASSMGGRSRTAWFLLWHFLADILAMLAEVMSLNLLHEFWLCVSNPSCEAHWCFSDLYKRREHWHKVDGMYKEHVKRTMELYDRSVRYRNVSNSLILVLEKKMNVFNLAIMFYWSSCRQLRWFCSRRVNPGPEQFSPCRHLLVLWCSMFCPKSNVILDYVFV